MSSKTNDAINDQYRQRLQSVCMIPPGYFLDVFEQRRSLALVELVPIPHIALLQELTPAEWLLFETFLRSEAFFCSHATLLATWSTLQEEVCQREMGSMRSVKEIIYRLKKKLQRFCLTIVAVIDQGYLLVSSQ